MEQHAMWTGLCGRNRAIVEMNPELREAFHQLERAMKELESSRVNPLLLFFELGEHLARMKFNPGRFGPDPIHQVAAALACKPKWLDDAVQFALWGRAKATELAGRIGHEEIRLVPMHVILIVGCSRESREFLLEEVFRQGLSPKALEKYIRRLKRQQSRRVPIPRSPKGWLMQATHRTKSTRSYFEEYLRSYVSDLASLEDSAAVTREIVAMTARLHEELLALADAARNTAAVVEEGLACLNAKLGAPRRHDDAIALEERHDRERDIRK